MLIGTPRELKPALGWELQGLTRLLDLAAHRFLSVASATSSASNSVIPVNASQTAKRFEKNRPPGPKSIQGLFPGNLLDNRFSARRLRRSFGAL